MYVSIKYDGILLQNRVCVDLPTTKAETPAQIAKIIRKDTAAMIGAKPSTLAWAVFFDVMAVFPTHKSANW